MTNSIFYVKLIGFTLIGLIIVGALTITPAIIFVGLTDEKESIVISFLTVAFFGPMFEELGKKMLLLKAGVKAGLATILVLALLESAAYIYAFISTSGFEFAVLLFVIVRLATTTMHMTTAIVMVKIPGKMGIAIAIAIHAIWNVIWVVIAQMVNLF